MDSFDAFIQSLPNLAPEAERLLRHGDDTGGVQGRRQCAGDPAVPGDLWTTADGLVVVHHVDVASGAAVAAPVDRDASGTALNGNVLGADLWWHPDRAVTMPLSSLVNRIGQTVDAITLAKGRRLEPVLVAVA